MLVDRFGVPIFFGSAFWSFRPKCPKPQAVEGSHAELGVEKRSRPLAHANLCCVEKLGLNP